MLDGAKRLMRWQGVDERGGGIAVGIHAEQTDPARDLAGHLARSPRWRVSGDPAGVTWALVTPAGSPNTRPIAAAVSRIRSAGSSELGQNPRGSAHHPWPAPSCDELNSGELQSTYCGKHNRWTSRCTRLVEVT